MAKATESGFRGFISHKSLETDDETWAILASCTHGEVEVVDAVLQGLGFKRPDRPKVQIHCEAMDIGLWPALWAVAQNTGMAMRIVLHRDGGRASGYEYAVVDYLDQIRPSSTIEGCWTISINTIFLSE